MTKKELEQYICNEILELRKEISNTYPSPELHMLRGNLMAYETILTKMNERRLK